jgi:hypothetical protein
MGHAARLARIQGPAKWSPAPLSEEIVRTPVYRSYQMCQRSLNGLSDGRSLTWDFPDIIDGWCGAEEACGAVAAGLRCR